MITTLETLALAPAALALTIAAFAAMAGALRGRTVAAAFAAALTLAAAPVATVSPLAVLDAAVAANRTARDAAGRIVRAGRVLHLARAYGRAVAALDTAREGGDAHAQIDAQIRAERAAAAFFAA